MEGNPKEALQKAIEILINVKLDAKDNNNELRLSQAVLNQVERFLTEQANNKGGSK